MEARMFNPTSLVAEALGRHLADTYDRRFGGREPEYGRILESAGRLVIEWIANSDALYHSTNHTALATLVGEAILRGRLLRQPLEPADWLHFTLALIMHDIGYVRGVCPGDEADRFVIDESGATVTLKRGASDAALAPYHVDRSKICVRERFVFNPLIEPDRLARNIELTRFPVPDDEDHAETDTEAAFVRAADLVGQLGDPLYPRKLNALFHEFEEIGVNKRLGYATPADVTDHYPRFFWSKVEPFLGEAVEALNMTAEGRQWLANLYSHVCVIEHGRRAMGPNPARAAASKGLIVRELTRR
jgi:hypothetical protein